MSNQSTDSLPTAIGKGAIAGLAGTVVMTAFQRFVEMPLTGRDESYAPAELVMKLFPVAPKSERGRRRLNYAAHFGVGVAWGAGHALIATRAGLRGQRAVATVFGAIWGGDVLANTALGLTKPMQWSRQDLTIDVVDKLVLAEATGLIFERL
ncbi:hypothetical protein BH20ACT18_BH20ACT18_04030 [soil metagenome]